MQNHTLLIHQSFAAKGDAGGTRHFEFGRQMVASGQKFTVVTSDVNYQTGLRVVHGNRMMTETYDDGVRILRARTYASLHVSYMRRLLAYLSFMISSLAVGIRAGRPDIVMGTSPPIFQAVSAWLLSLVRRRPFLLEVRDLWPEFAIDIGILRNPLLIAASRRLERFLYRRADYLLVNSPAYRDYLIGKGVQPGKVTLIPNGVDARMFDPLDRGQPFREQFGLNGKFVVTYAGAIGLANDIDVVVDAAEMLRERADIRILIVGEGKERRRIEERVKKLGLENMIFTGSFPKARMPQVLAASDACLAILRNIKMFATTYPNKVFDYMAAGRPTLLAIDGVIRKVIEAAQGGRFVAPGNAAALAEAIAQLADAPENARAMGARARAYVVEHFNREDHAREFSRLLACVAAGTPAYPAEAEPGD